ncbi:hypothetical protein BPOR_0316g00020 [Botrytis porri]|uniref:Uncharacterized protein n=1 Tax=Botrytis porri TaxID=87229 RepID=A0A4Z1KQN3_9HELO|nr:hypothetical protein BPOR_0316g00020 [Botrytis porri]
MKTQSFSTPSPVTSPEIAQRREISQNGPPKTPPNTRMLSPPGAPRQSRFVRPEVTPQSNGAFRNRIVEVIVQHHDGGRIVEMPALVHLQEIMRLDTGTDP